MKKIVIIGAGGFAREVAWLIEEINNKNLEWDLLGFIEEGNKQIGSILNNHKILGDFEWIINSGHDNLFYICAVGDPKLRIRFNEKAEKLNIKPATLIHPNAKISNYNIIGEGTIICYGAIITTNVTIGKHVVISVNSVISHDSIISDFSTILPSVTISGNVKIGTGCYIGTTAAIINKINIGCNTIVGAGATVTKDLPDNCTAVGTPAKPIKFHLI
ncbi:transferase [Clostridium beijerinckii]|nr:transferase [Clostridium beijerinckii]